MPITKSAKKALRGSDTKKGFNIKKKELINKAIKQVKKLVSEKKLKEARAFMPLAQKSFDKSFKTGLMTTKQNKKK